MTSQRYCSQRYRTQYGGYVLQWQRYDNNKMAAMRYYGNCTVQL
jgi:hypothetical protein